MIHMKYIINFIKAIFIFLIIVLVVYNVYNYINIKVLKNDLTKVNGYAVLEVVSGSMEPTIKVGDIIVIDTHSKKYEIGDVITFYDTNGNFVTHRIVDIEGGKMITKGDNNKSVDENMTIDHIVGKYIYKVPFLGAFLNIFRNPIYLTLILVIGMLFCYLISTDKDGKPIVVKKQNRFDNWTW